MDREAVRKFPMELLSMVRDQKGSLHQGSPKALVLFSTSNDDLHDGTERIFMKMTSTGVTEVH